MALLRYTALRFLVFLAVAALLWIVGLRDFILLLAALLISGVISWFVLNRSRGQVSTALVDRQRKIKERLAGKKAAEDAWNDEARGAADR